MNIQELIAKAAKQTGSMKALATKLKKNPGRITEWNQGIRKPDAYEIAKIAEICKMPIFRTIAEIEINLFPENKQTWEKAIKELNASSESHQI